MSQSGHPGEPLCCCEYYNADGERSHLMACCCECDALDETCDKMFKCERVSENTLDRLFDTISDRLRLPWMSGAAKVQWDVVLPILTVPTCLCLATLHPVVTVLVFLAMPIFIQIFYQLWRRRSKVTASPFFYSWGLTSVATCYFVFQVFLMIFREVLLWEMLLMFTMVAAMFYLLTLIRADPGLLKVTPRPRASHKRTPSSSGSSLGATSPLYDQRSGDRLDSNHVLYASEAGDLLSRERNTQSADLPPRVGYCKICDAYISVRDHHCVWINTCVGAANHRYFLLAMILFVTTGSYGAHLALTTVCTPKMYMDWFLMPNDCRWLYVDFVTAICFVTAVYAILATVCVCIGLVFQLVLISQNVTSHELATARRQGRTRCLLWLTDNPNNRGFVRNWMEFWFLGARTAHSHAATP